MSLSLRVEDLDKTDPDRVNAGRFGVFGLIFVFALASVEASAQSATGPSDDFPVAETAKQLPPDFKERTSKNPSASCLQPDKLPGLEEYDGPMKKTVGVFSRAIERGSVVSKVHYKSGPVLCDFGTKDKFLLFADNAIDPMLILSAAFDAGIDHASNRDPTFGQGGLGYTKRLGASYADWTSSAFFKNFAYPVIFSEDPRYYRLGQGPAGRRVLHAAGHLFITHRSDGTHTFNSSEWLGTASAAAVSNFWHPGNSPGAGDMARRAAVEFGFDVGFDVLREFWPDIARKMKLPFRGLAPRPSAAPQERVPEVTH